MIVAVTGRAQNDVVRSQNQHHLAAEPTPDRPRRQRLSEESRREQIIQATLAVVAQQGYEQASLSRIARQAGVSKGLVSHYFDDKDDLMEAAVRITANGLRDRIAAGLDLSAPVPEVIRAAIRQVARMSATHRLELTAITEIISQLRRPDGSRRLDLSLYEETYQAQQRLFRRGQEAGDLRPFDTRVMAVTYQGSIDMMLAYLETHPETDADEYADALTDLILAAVSAH